MTIESIESNEGVEKGKSCMNPDKMKWDYKLRNIILVALSLMFFVNVLLFFDSQVYFDFILNYSLSGVPLNFIFTAFYMYHFWKYMNSAKEDNFSPARIDITGWIVIAFWFSSGIYMILTGKALPLPFDLAMNVFLSSGFFFSLIMYPLILYWERKNLMTIYLMQEKSSKLKPVAIPDKALRRMEKKQAEA